jgi:adenosylcobyric acid synthase
MVQGTGSGAGKSLLAAALCRLYSDRGIRVAPFKSQNMALNSYITRDGGEIGRAQALQAEAARIEPTVDMNPILLKASGHTGSQVIIHGKVRATMKAQEYYAFRKTAWDAARESYDRLSRQYDLIIIEGAGSPAEINLMDVDIVNMSVAKYAKAPVLLVGDIDKGGVFASLFGTVKLLGRDSRYVRGLIINKFRGDHSILKPGLDMIELLTGKPVIGVIPYLTKIGLPEEDGLALGPAGRSGTAAHVQKDGASRAGRRKDEKVKIVVVRLQYIANFTDFDAFLCEPDVDLVYSQHPTDIENADLVIVPGSKNTFSDLAFLKESRLGGSIRKAHARGIQVIGICGGYQMLGRSLHDPSAIESPRRVMRGLGLLDVATVFEPRKITAQVEAVWTEGGKRGMSERLSLDASAFSTPLRGYEIHMGVSKGDIGLFQVSRRASAEEVEAVPVPDGSLNGVCWGTYLHGIFDNDFFRRALIDSLRTRKGMQPLRQVLRYGEAKEQALDRLAGFFSSNLDWNLLDRILSL